MVSSALIGINSRVRAIHPMRRYLLRKGVTRALNRVRLRGQTVFCPRCGRSANAFLERSICAFCESRPRQRFLWLYLEGLIRMGDCVLHFAPEECLASRLRKIPGVGYVSADLRPIHADVHVDLDSPAEVTGRLGESAYSVVIMSHVLEHVRDDIAVMGSLRRLLTEDGCVLAQVPLDRAVSGHTRTGVLRRRRGG